MFFQTTENLTHNPQNCPDDARNGNSAYSADGSRRIQILFSELQTAGVSLFVEDGRLAFDAPGDAMTDDLLARVRADRDGLLALLRADQSATPEPSGVSCPFCRSDSLEDCELGWRCLKCKRLAWRWLDGGSIVRVDLEGMALLWI